MMIADPIALLQHPAPSVLHVLAYQCWETRGRPLWDDQRDWYEAQRLCADNNLGASKLAAMTKWRAIQLWDLNGRPAGRDTEFWLQAEEEVLDTAPYLMSYVTQQDIAHYLWQMRGCPDGDGLTDWLKAGRLAHSLTS